MPRYRLPKALQPGGPGLRVSTPVRTTASVPAHSHQFAELSIVTGGSAMHRRQQQYQQIGKGDVFLVRDQQQHSLDTCHDLERCMVIFDYQRLLGDNPLLQAMPGFAAFFKLEPDLPADAAGSPALKLNEVDLSQAVHLCQLMKTELNEALEGSVLLSHNLLQELAIFLARRLQQSSQATQKSMCRVARALRCIEEHSTEQLELDDLSIAAACSSNQLIRDFKAVTGSHTKEVPHDSSTPSRLRSARRW